MLGFSCETGTTFFPQLKQLEPSTSPARRGGRLLAMPESVNRVLRLESVPTAGVWAGAKVFASTFPGFPIDASPAGAAETLEPRYRGPSD